MDMDKFERGCSLVTRALFYLAGAISLLAGIVWLARQVI